MRPLFLLLSLLSLGCSRTELLVERRCGNGLLESNEECDDGNHIDHDACSNSCRERMCGNAIVEPTEECDLGADNVDRPALELLHEALSGGRRPVMPVDRPRDVVSFYDYTSESSHTGFEGQKISALFLYRDTGREVLSLVNHHGIDEDRSGVTIAHGLVSMDFEGVPSSSNIAIADEGDEMFFSGDGGVQGRFEFWRNTDGGALQGLPFPGDWRIDVTVSFLIGITAWRYFLADGSEVALDDDLVASLIAHATPSRCRTDCTIPACGDGFVDGGEVCDDGNTQSGDGCAADCRSLRDR